MRKQDDQIGPVLLINRSAATDMNQVLQDGKRANLGGNDYYY